MSHPIFLWPIGLIVILLTLGGCASQPLPEKHSYLLRVPATPERQMEGSWGGIKRLTVPSYLESQQMMIMVSEIEVKPVRFHRWGEPPKEGIRRYLDGRLATKVASRELVDISYVDIEIAEFLGAVEGAVRLRADYSISTGPVASTKQTFDMTVTQSRDGYAGLVDAHAELLDLLADSISKSAAGQVLVRAKRELPDS